MKNPLNSGKARVAALIVLSIAAGAAVIAQTVSPVQGKERVSSTLNALKRDPMFLLTGRVEDLEKLTESLAKNLKKSQDELKSAQQEIQSLKDGSRPPKGYTSMYITKTNFNNVDGTALMKFFVRY